MKHKKMSIKWHIFIYLIGFTAFLLGLLWYFQIVHLNSSYESIKKNELKTAADKLYANLNSDDLEDYISTLADKYDMEINLTDSEGKSIYSANLMPKSHIYIPDSTTYDCFYNKVKQNGGTVSYEVNGRYNDNISQKPPKDDRTLVFDENESMYSSDSDEPMHAPEAGAEGGMMKSYVSQAKSMIYIKLVTDTQGEEHLILMSMLITPVDATVYTLRVQFIYISAVFVVTAVAIAFVISNIISKPIRKINESAKNLAGGNFDTGFDGRGYREVEELSHTLNYAAGELGKSEQLQRDLLANVSHDLRTPLTMITAYSEVMRDIPGENTPENVQIIIDETKRLTNLVNDMLELSKLQAGVSEISAEVFDFTTSILAVLKRYSKLTGQSGYDIRFEYSDDVKVCADEYKIYQVIYNLINNAINYAGDDKTVIVRQIVNGEIVRLEVEDHGKGIAEDEIDSIWDRYYKVDKTHKRATQGSGIGLSIVKNILKLHEARFGVNSKVGEGSVFWFELKTVNPPDEQ